MLCYAMLCYAMLCYAMLCYAMLCYAMLCYAMLCCGMLCRHVIGCSMSRVPVPAAMQLTDTYDGQLSICRNSVVLALQQVQKQSAHQHGASLQMNVLDNSLVEVDRLEVPIVEPPEPILDAKNLIRRYTIIFKSENNVLNDIVQARA